MKCFFTFAVAAALAVAMNGTLWSQAGGGGGAGGGPSGGASGGSSAAGSAGAGAAGAAGTAGNTANAGTAGNTNAAAAAGNAGAATNTGAAAAGNTNTNAAGAVGAAGAGAVNPQAVGTGRANAAAAGRASNSQSINAPAARNMNRQARVQGNFQNSNPNQTPFFADPGVRQQLNLNDTQFNTLNSAYQNAYTRYNQAVNNLSPALTPEQREVQIQQLQQQFNAGLGQISGSTLTNPQTLTRFNQLNRQFMGAEAFNDPSIRQQLNLTPAQARQLRTLQNNWQQQLQQFGQSAGNDQSAANTTQWNQMWQQYNASLNSVLTPQQQQMWAQQVGQSYPVSPNSFLTQQRRDGNVNVAPPAEPPFAPRVPYGGRTTQGVQPPTAAPVPATAQTPTGTQPTTQGTSAPATASGTSTQGGTVR